MNRLLRAAATAAFLLPLAAAPATGQNYRGAFGVYGGGIWFSDLNNNGNVPAGTVRNGFLIGNTDLSLEPGWVTGAQLEAWLGNGRVGLRANGSYTDREFQLDNNDEFGIEREDVNVWLFDGDLMLRLLRPQRERVFAPYLTLGAGVAHYNPAGNGLIFVPEANAFMGDTAGQRGDNDETRFAGVVGIGTDILPAGFRLGGARLGLRLELADHIAFDSPMEPIVRFQDNDFGPVHNVRATLGIHALFGRIFPEPVAVVTPPPAPPPPPAEEMITVCVIDPATGQTREVSAVFMPSTGDTLAIVNGQRMPFETAYPATAPVYARNATWFMRGEPLTITIAGQRLQYVTFGGARVIEPEELALLGRVNGVPIFADADDVADIRDELEDALETSATDDLEDILEEHRKLREEIEDLDVVYVPLQPGCVFQPLRRAEEVRKVRG